MQHKKTSPLPRVRVSAQTEGESQGGGVPRCASSTAAARAKALQFPCAATANANGIHTITGSKSRQPIVILLGIRDHFPHPLNVGATLVVALRRLQRATGGHKARPYIHAANGIHIIASEKSRRPNTITWSIKTNPARPALFAKKCIARAPRHKLTHLLPTLSAIRNT